MRNILIISLLFVSCLVFGQIPASNIALDPNKSKDDPYFLLSDTSGVYRGRAQFHTKAYVSGLLEPYLGCIDTFFVRNDSLFIYTTDLDSIEFAGGGSGADLTLMRLVNSSNSATHTILLTNNNSPQGSVRLTEGGGVTFATTGTSDDAIVTFSTSGLLHTTDTASMVSHFIERGDTSTMLTHYIERGDTASMLDPYTPNWTDSGNYIYPAENDSVFIPSHFSGTGILNISGRIDTRYPNSSSNNIAIGYNSSAAMDATEVKNIAIGDSTLSRTSGSPGGNVAIGDRAMANVTGVGTAPNVAIGEAAMYNATYGSGNVAIGWFALLNGAGVNTGLSQGMSVAIGNTSGYGSTSSAIRNTYLGALSGYTNSTGDRNVFLGYGAGYSETNSDRLYIESSNSSTPLIFGNFSADSIHIYGKLGYETNGSTPTKIAGRSGTQFSDITLGSDLSLTSGTLSTNLSGTYQPLDADLTYLAGVTLSANVKTLLNAADYSAFKTSLSLNNVENTALSTWAGSSNITTLGTVSTGTWSGSTIAINKGGTGQTTASAAFDALAPSQTSNSGKYLTTNGTTTSWATVSGSGDALTTNPLSQFASTTSSQLAGVISDETGTDKLVYNTSPTLVTPILGTPTSGDLTNCTFPTLNQNTTGSAATLTTPRTIDGLSFDGSANISHMLAISHTEETKVNSTTSDQDYTSLYTIPANYLTDGKLLHITIFYWYKTGTSSVTVNQYLKIGSTKLWLGNAGVNLPDGVSVEKSSIQQFWIMGEAAASGAAPIICTSDGFSIAGAGNIVPQPTNVATNGTLAITPGVTFSGTGSTETMGIEAFWIQAEN